MNSSVCYSLVASWAEYTGVHGMLNTQVLCIGFHHSRVFPACLVIPGPILTAGLPTHNASAGTVVAHSERSLPGKDSRPLLVYTVPTASCWLSGSLISDFDTQYSWFLFGPLTSSLSYELFSISKPFAGYSLWLPHFLQFQVNRAHVNPDLCEILLAGLGSLT